MMHMIANILFSHKKDSDIYLERKIFGFSLCESVDSYSDISLCTFHISTISTRHICQWSEIATPHVHITAFEKKYSDCQVNHLVQAVALIQLDECKSKLLIFTYETACI